MALESSPIACRPSELAHFVLRTKNSQQLIDFYQNFLNARITHSTDIITFMTWDHEHHRFAILKDPNAVPKQDNAVGVDHFALTFDSLGQLLQAYKTRKEAGIEPAYCVNHGVSMSMYYKDPDGNKIENQVDAFETKEEAIQYMASAEFTRDPRGPTFDPEELLRRFEAGEDEKILMKRT
ncbi:glyoxalase/Bleomycin resistance protein/Dioxygenase superfamily protein [Colletotrichum graminicola]|uniref:Glyoxalase/Bleomycin resistance protein/Dioxygenase superfamily protein n=1 Tax=Colletotrichum graminicola (strain M1.001 / M2 / FGSC 10212) TaxID=645133 RepID=E3Q409_COLGM|nr:glyoxalase/Bleomycin resistance protein/Dioxygenase superfamily protein [Colletotrichum graminicola M1.001]EFQ25761.1 glyoxalase/Bleomycin resistance protein/Dioxygenase superfamily protein [Colletotrichum graminicola M1.001]WDK10881.1 glyoxalase/Bleomycin resistance protein/Dioxygenase superfamily protein [Colletotrichum graminicola]